MSNPLLVGIDPHRRTNTICLMDGHGCEVGRRFTVDNNRPGTETFVQSVSQAAQAGPFDQIEIASEATGWYWFLFFQTLSQDPVLNQWPLHLYPINPRLTAKFKETYTDLDHTDPYDAFVTADRLRLGRDLPAPFRPDDTYLPIRFLTRYRYHVMHNLAREKAYCLSILYLKASEYTRQDGDKPHQDQRPFSNVFGAASRAVIQEFASIEEIAALPFEELVAFIDAKGKARFADPSENARRLQRVARDSYPLPEALQAPIQLILKLSLQQITALEQQEKRLHVAITDLMATIPHTLDTIPGFGPVFSAGILSEIGDLSRFHSDVQAQVAKLAGFKWRKRQSGDFEAEDTELTRARNRYLRYYFCEAANSVRMHDAEYAAYYDRKYNEVRKHQHKRAIVLTARKLVRLVVRLLTTNQTYQPRRR
jgi:transposase